jgi:hypothetical protein
MKQIRIAFSLIFILIFTSNCFGISFSKEEKKPNYRTMTGVFASVNTKILQSQDSIAIQNELTLLAEKIKEYTRQTTREMPEEFYQDNIQTVILYGMLGIMNEKVAIEGRLTPDAALDCLGSAIGTALGLNEVYGDIVAIVNGTFSPGTFYGLAKKVLKRYLGWIALGIGIYSFGHCIGVW